MVNEKNLRPGGLTDVPGILVGNAENKEGRSGCTVILCPDRAVVGVDVRGGAAGTLLTDMIRPGNAADTVEAIMLTGGSAFGLPAVAGVNRWLVEQGTDVPIVPAAVIYDLVYAKGTNPPDADMAYAACRAANAGPVVEGNVGAGAGATVGKVYGTPMKGGLGTASVQIHDGPIVSALVIVNPVGDVWNRGCILAGAQWPDGTFVDITRTFLSGAPSPLPGQPKSTTIAVVATTARLTMAEASRVATLAHDGMARAISPVHTQDDGDTVFCLATGSDTSNLTGDAAVTVVGTAAAVVLEQAIIRGVLAANRWRRIY